jgi:hypothetical protein
MRIIYLRLIFDRSNCQSLWLAIASFVWKRIINNFYWNSDLFVSENFQTWQQCEALSLCLTVVAAMSTIDGDMLKRVWDELD